ncbi:MAG: DUF1080 domain-containing protein, partial [Phycisphaerae bacterium]|nr:DUF1080 domain-containing protein [Phycisphaerae bacterium]
PPGKWQTLDVVFRAPRFDKTGHKIANARFEKVVHNGVLVHRDVELTEGMGGQVQKPCTAGNRLVLHNPQGLVRT